MVNLLIWVTFVTKGGGEGVACEAVSCVCPAVRGVNCEPCRRKNQVTYGPWEYEIRNR